MVVMDGMIVVVAMDADDEGGTWTGEDDPAATAATGVNMGVDVDEATIGVCAGVLEAGRTRGAAVDAPAPAAGKGVGGNSAVDDKGWPEKLTPEAIGSAWKKD